MSQHGAPTPVMARQPVNGLGIAGFVVSLVGLLVTGGMLSPIGLILSLIALGRPYGKGFAWAGVILGLLGSCWLIGVVVAVVVVGAAAVLALFGLGIAMVALSEPEKLEITTDMVSTAIAVVTYREENGYLPADLDVLRLKPANLNDPWGNPYQYWHTDDDEFDLVSAGEDGQFETEDDIRLSELGKAWEGAGFGIHVDEDPDGGRVTIRVGRGEIELRGDEDRGTITIDTGERVIEIVGDDDGGRVRSHSKDESESSDDEHADEDEDDGEEHDEHGDGNG